VRYLALDWGTVRIGAAVSDPEGKIAFPLDKYIDSKNAIDEIKKIIEELQVEKILVGLPKGLNNQETESTREAVKFIENLKNQVGPPIETLDERFSSVAAGKTLTDQGISEKDQRSIKDNIAAQIMLQQYLDKL
jgi:putative Holliday junction resolvase